MPEKNLKQVLRTRELVIDTIRAYFKSNDFLEVSTPIIVRSPGTEPYLDVFETTLQQPQQPDQTAYLITSPEYAIKKLIAQGVGSCFEITKSFRNNEGSSSRHNAEFTILEWYHVNGSYLDVMTDFEGLLQAIAQAVLGSTQLSYQGGQYDLSAPWERITVKEAFERFAQVDEQTLLDVRALPEAARQKGLSQAEDLTWEEAFHLILLNQIESQLGLTKPTILYDYPIQLAALAQPKTTNPRYAERFEVYLAGLELGNAFSELLDAAEQRRRFEAELAERAALGKVTYPIDEAYLAALQAGLPPTGGIAVGVDRLVMLFADVPSITDTLPFATETLFFPE